jgi:hypothetical protein
MEELIRRTVGPAMPAGGLWASLIDPGQLESALLNLCMIARDAMPDGGRLPIETGNHWLDETAARERDLPQPEPARDMRGGSQTRGRDLRPCLT